jgi:DNA-binding CsgD family transcriptional regulator
MKERDKKVIERNKTKTFEGEFIYELLNSYELSPVLSEQILLSAKQILLRERTIRQGQIEATVLGIEERAGKTIEVMYKKQVVLTVDAGIEDTEVLKKYGRVVLRQVRMQRITEEAIEQKGILSQEDISKYLYCDVRTVRRDIRQIKKGGIEIITRGVLHNIGRGQTHKQKIIGLYLDGLFFSDIRLKTHHSIGAIKRYVNDFMKVLMSIKKGIKQEEEISSVTGISINLIKQYKQILKESKGQKHREMKLRFLNTMYKDSVKKTIEYTGYPVVRTIGGSK